VLNINGVHVGKLKTDGSVTIDDKQDLFGNLEDLVEAWMVEIGDIKDGHYLVMAIEGVVNEFKSDRLLDEILRERYKEIQKENPGYNEYETDEEILEDIKHRLAVIK